MTTETPCLSGCVLSWATGDEKGKGLSTVLRRLLARITADAETTRNHESQARDARVYIASLEAERVALRAQVETLRKALKAALGHCDCSDYNGKALIPCTDANPCSGCYTTQTGQAALAATEPKGEAKWTQARACAEAGGLAVRAVRASA